MRNLSTVLYLSAGVFILNTSSAVVNFAITDAIVLDDGNFQSLNSSSLYTPAGDADLQSFTSGGTTYDTANFISGVSVGNAQLNAPGFIQRAGFVDEFDPKFTDGDPTSQFQTGSTDVASFLSHGARGLSMSTGINYIADRDPISTIKFDATISDTNALLDSTPDFLFGDVANSHSDDIFRLRDASGNALIEVTLLNGAWSDMGRHVIDRLNADGSNLSDSVLGDPTRADNTNKGVGLIAFSLEVSDLTPYAIANFGSTEADFLAAMGTVAEIEIVVGGVADGPRTDYAFFGINENAIDAPSAVPEPATAGLLLGVAVIGFAGLRRRRRN